MKNIIIGTAGHIDHGKTTLIKSLTKIDTDRLAEEKKRGITIDLGFAFFDLPSGKKAGIVDVPGHEKFIKNMLAGVSGIDLVLFVISAEEGVMPQTQEHLDILSILDVQKGIVVLTKKDLVDDEWLSLIKADIKETMKGTFLENAPYISVSSLTGDGFDELINEIDKMSEEVEVKSTSAALRFPIDRVFTLKGFGTVVTGTLVEGSVSEGDILEVFPSEKELKVRGIQVHSESVNKAYAGQRVAMNITGLNKSDINRGEILAHKDSMQVTSMLDIKLKLLKSSHREIGNWTRLRLYHGTKEILCRLVLLDKETLKPGEECFAQLRLEEPTACKYGDRFVIRFYSPLETIGGGVILDPNALKHKRFKEEIIEELLFKEAGKQDEIIETIIKKNCHEIINIEYVIKQSGLKKEEVEPLLEELKSNEVIFQLSKGVLIHKEYLIEKEQEMIILISAFHEKYPLRLGMLKEEVRNKLFTNVKNKLFDEILSLYNEVIHIQSRYISLYNFEVVYSDDQLISIKKMKNILDEGKFKPKSMDDIYKEFSSVKHFKDIVSNLVEVKELIRITDNIFFTKETYEKILILIKSKFDEKSALSLGELKDVLDTSRKFIVPIMEHFDNIGLTKRVGDERMLR